MINIEVLEIVGPALIAGLMIALTHALLGIEVVRRGIVFMDLASAQMAGLGLVLAGSIFHQPDTIIQQAIALAYAIGAGMFFLWIEKAWPKQQEAIIGSCFVLAASLALLILANQPQGGEDIQHLLSGQMLFITWQDVLQHSPIYISIVTLWFLIPKIRTGIGFYLIFAVAITSSVQLIGVYVVFASLILPALAAFDRMHPYRIAWICGVLSILSGIIIAVFYNLPAGPVTVVTYCIIMICTRLLYFFFCRNKKERPNSEL